ncbi:response regulator transcription factor [Oscillatoria sp. CS-180]|uniref:response regulator n=1 Tax=Oscillatoria sp. CS-180 TaxID=3021720 RepID=UPI002330AA5C|nr:response regulator transcription factor [Oscillatoria sp. CS-180]MDB9524876.1 response regulator transcription factor [Oscillatoria sp. CS-180]
MSNIRIVLIEDHNLTRMGIKVAFKEQPGMELVGEAANGMSGVSLLETHLPDVAVVDIGLPDIDGIEVVKRFRASQANNDATSKTKILMLTMHDSEEAVMAAFAAGADSYCMKQTELDDLMTAIRETETGNSWIDPAIASVVLRQMRQSPVAANTVDATVSISALEPEYTQVIETYPLTERELEILELIVEGCSNAEIADRSYITVGTVKTHVRNILNKLGVDDRTKAAVRALRAGLVS